MPLPAPCWDSTLTSRSHRPDLAGMAVDPEKIDEAVLALLYLSLHDERRAWKSLDWDATDRLHTKGLISDPRGRAKSVIFSDDGLVAAKTAFERLFGLEQSNTVT